MMPPLDQIRNYLEDGNAFYTDRAGSDNIMQAWAANPYAAACTALIALPAERAVCPEAGFLCH